MGVMYIRDEKGKPIPIPGGSGGKPVVYPDWSRFTWYVMGDSLTEKTHTYTDKHYYDFVQEKTGIKLIVDGISSTGYKNNSGGKTFLERVQNAFPTEQEMEGDPQKKEMGEATKEVDVITIFGSGNDLKKDDPKYSDTEIWLTLKWLMENRPGLPVIVVPPSLWRSTDTHNYNKWEDPWKSYCERLQLCAFKCNHRYLSDMYDCPPFYPDFEEHMKKFFTTDPNGIHPNEEGHKALAQYFYNALLQELSLRV